MERVTTFKYNNNLYNFADPQVFKSFTRSEKHGQRTWRKTYGFQFTKQIPGFKATNKTLDATSCLKKCIKMENSRFARLCKERGGHFKCCMTYWWLDPFEEARNDLIKDGLIKDKASHICKANSSKNPCLYCSMNGFCTNSDPQPSFSLPHLFVNFKMENVFV